MRLVLGLLFWSVPPALALLSYAAWLRGSYLVLGVMLAGLYVGLPCVPVGLLILPPGSRARAVLWASLPLLGSFAVIFGLPQTVGA